MWPMNRSSVDRWLLQIANIIGAKAHPRPQSPRSRKPTHNQCPEIAAYVFGTVRFVRGTEPAGPTYLRHDCPV